MVPRQRRRGEGEVVAALPGTPYRAIAVLFWCCGTGRWCTHTSSSQSARQTPSRAATRAKGTPCLDSGGASPENAPKIWEETSFRLLPHVSVSRRYGAFKKQTNKKTVESKWNVLKIHLYKHLHDQPLYIE